MSNTRNGFFAQAKQEISIDLKAIRQDYAENSSSYSVMLRTFLILSFMVMFMFARMVDKSKAIKKLVTNQPLNLPETQKLRLLSKPNLRENVYFEVARAAVIIVCIQLQLRLMDILEKRSKIISMLNVSDDEIIESIVDELPDNIKEELHQEKLLEKDDKNKYYFNKPFYSHTARALLVKPMVIDLVKEDKNEYGEVVNITKVEIQDKAFIKDYFKSRSHSLEQGTLPSLSIPGYTVVPNAEPRSAPTIEIDLIEYKKDLKQRLSEKIQKFSAVFTEKREELLELHKKLTIS